MKPKDRAAALLEAADFADKCRADDVAHRPITNVHRAPLEAAWKRVAKRLRERAVEIMERE